MPKHKTLKSFVTALSAGEVPNGSRAVVWTSTGAVEILTPYRKTGGGDVLFRAETSDDFVMAFAKAFGLKGDVS